jgi:hypothetical protein
MIFRLFVWMRQRDAEEAKKETLRVDLFGWMTEGMECNAWWERRREGEGEPVNNEVKSVVVGRRRFWAPGEGRSWLIHSSSVSIHSTWNWDRGSRRDVHQISDDSVMTRTTGDTWIFVNLVPYIFHSLSDKGIFKLKSVLVQTKRACCTSTGMNTGRTHSWLE